MLAKQEPDATHPNLRYATRPDADPPPASKTQLAYNGRINAEKALAAIPPRVD